MKFGSSPFRRKRNVCQYKPVYTLNELNCSCFCHIINILSTELSWSVWENLDLGRVYRPHCVRSVLTTSVKILPYRPPARLIRAKHNCSNQKCHLCMLINSLFSHQLNCLFCLDRNDLMCPSAKTETSHQRFKEGVVSMFRKILSTYIEGNLRKH